MSASKPTITLFTPKFSQFNSHPQFTLNNSILPHERTPCILGVTFDPHFKFNAHIKSLVTPYQDPHGHPGSAKGNHTYHL